MQIFKSISYLYYERTKSAYNSSSTSAVAPSSSLPLTRAGVEPREGVELAFLLDMREVGGLLVSSSPAPAPAPAPLYGRRDPRGVLERLTVAPLRSTVTPTV